MRLFCLHKAVLYGDFLDDPVVKNPPCNEGFMGSIPHWGAEIPHATKQLSPHTAVTEACGLGTQAPRLESLCAAMKDPVYCV